MKFSESYPIKEKGTNIVVETTLDPTFVSIEPQVYTVISEGVYFYETKTVVVDNTPTTYYQQYIRSEIIENAHNLAPGQLVNQQTLVYMCGLNTSGQLGVNDTVTRSSPVAVMASKLINISSDSHTLALSDDGIIWAWGTNTTGQLGLNDTNNRSSPVSLNMAPSIFVGISVDGTNACSYGLDHLGYAWAWGTGLNGRLAQNVNVNNYSSPVTVVSGGNRYVSIKKGRAIDFNNYCWAWGDNGSGQLGDNSINHRSSPISIVGGIIDSLIIDAGDTYTAILSRDGTLRTCGLNSSGQLGIGTDTNNRSSPVVVSTNRKFIDIACGASHCIALDSNGFVWCWGDNTYGQLGLADTSNRSTPVSVGNQKFTLIGARANSSIAIDPNGVAWVWGRNENGQLGLNSTANKSRPDFIRIDQIWKTRKAS